MRRYHATLLISIADDTLGGIVPTGLLTGSQAVSPENPPVSYSWRSATWNPPRE